MYICLDSILDRYIRFHTGELAEHRTSHRFAGEQTAWANSSWNQFWLLFFNFQIWVPNAIARFDFFFASSRFAVISLQWSSVRIVRPTFFGLKNCTLQYKILISAAKSWTLLNLSDILASLAMEVIFEWHIIALKFEHLKPLKAHKE